jgi:hypothetical protein
VAAVHQPERSLLTRDGDAVGFDFLLLALGARSKRTLRQGQVWERGGDPALILAWAANDARVTLITAEQRPLGALGHAATDAVAGELDAAGVEVITGVEVIDEPLSGPAPPGLAELMLVPEEPVDEADALIGEPIDPARVRLGASSAAEFDRLISLPSVVGPFIAGVPTDAAGFIEVDAGLKVCGSERVWAAGGCIAAALEHSALAAQQADAAIAAIAAADIAGTGSVSATPPDAPDLTGLLLTGQRDRWLAENPAGTREPSTRCLWWPPGRAVGQMLARRIAAWDPSVHGDLPGQTGGLGIRAPVALGCSRQHSPGAGAELSAEVRRARMRDIENRQLMAIQRRERDAEAELRALSSRLETLGTQQQEVIHELRRHGYLRDQQS